MDDYLNDLGENEYWFYGDRALVNNSFISNWICRSNNFISHRCPESTDIEHRKPNVRALECFKVYRRQLDALEKMTEMGPNYRLFSFESSESAEGQRQFMVTTIGEFWEWYEKQLNVSFYELIPEYTPCRLYFDLEFYRSANYDVNEIELLNGFYICLKKALKDVYGIEFVTSEQAVVLDASTGVKFSQHVIIHLSDNRFFPSNISIKPLTKVLEERMINLNLGMVWNKDQTKRTPLFDMGVYTRNRNFRLYLSTKLNMSNPLILSSQCDFYRSGTAKKKQVFLDSLVVPASLSKNYALVNSISTASAVVHRSITDYSDQIPGNSRIDCANSTDGYGSTSPYPVIDQFILMVNRKWNERASLRKWVLHHTPRQKIHQITYFLAGCRYCFNIGREHRSNGTYWIVDMHKQTFYQKCFDIDCRSHCSNHFPLPLFVVESLPS